MGQVNSQMNELSDKEMLRYSRHILLKEVRLHETVKASVGKCCSSRCGPDRQPAFYLAAAGIGKLILIDDDAVELSELTAPVLYKVNHLGQKRWLQQVKCLQV